MVMTTMPDRAGLLASATGVTKASDARGDGKRVGPFALYGLLFTLTRGAPWSHILILTLSACLFLFTALQRPSLPVALTPTGNSTLREKTPSSRRNSGLAADIELVNP